jgi:hypothetical protein
LLKMAATNVLSQVFVTALHSCVDTEACQLRSGLLLLVGGFSCFRNFHVHDLRRLTVVNTRLKEGELSL